MFTYELKAQYNPIIDLSYDEVKLIQRQLYRLLNNSGYDMTFVTLKKVRV